MARPLGVAPAGHRKGAIRLADGSGYSRKSRITADAMARVLCWMGRRSDAKRWREAMAAEQADTTLEGTVEVDGAYFGGYVKPENRKEDRVDRRLSEHKSGKRPTPEDRPPELREKGLER